MILLRAASVLSAAGILKSVRIQRTRARNISTLHGLHRDSAYGLTPIGVAFLLCSFKSLISKSVCLSFTDVSYFYIAKEKPEL